jgi:hypothetical protein
LATGLPPDDEDQPTMALLPTMPPFPENPRAIQDLLSGADSTKLHWFVAEFLYCR